MPNEDDETFARGRCEHEQALRFLNVKAWKKHVYGEFRDEFASQYTTPEGSYFDPETIRKAIIHLDPDVVPHEPSASEEAAYREMFAPALPAPAGPRPAWDDYFLGLAFLASRRSPDLTTKHGCVIVDPVRHHVIGTGYNGFRPGLDDDEMAQRKPKPHGEIIHAERNCVDNCTIDPASTTGLRAYVTGRCCAKCARYLAANGVLDWVMADRRGFSNPARDDAGRFDEVVAEYGVTVRRIKPDLSWMVDGAFLDDLRGCGFL